MNFFHKSNDDIIIIMWFPSFVPHTCINSHTNTEDLTSNFVDFYVCKLDLERMRVVAAIEAIEILPDLLVSRESPEVLGSFYDLDITA